MVSQLTTFAIGFQCYVLTFHKRIILVKKIVRVTSYVTLINIAKKNFKLFKFLNSNKAHYNVVTI